MAYLALDIAKKILAKASLNPDAEDLISNMKLQKMLYYQQGFHLAYFNTPLFDEEIEAWMYGPVVPDVYKHFSSHGNKGIEYLGDVISLTQEEESLFGKVDKVYGKYSAIGLMNMTHQEKPWKSVSVRDVITKEEMRKYFNTRLK